MDKWSTLRQVLEDDLKIFLEQAGGRWDVSNRHDKQWAEQAASVIEVYLNLMDELDKESDDGGRT